MDIMKKLPQELKLITLDEYRKHVAHRKTLTHRKFHESLYIAPDGRILDCRYPDESQSHLTTSQIFYSVIDILAKTDMYKNLKLEESFAFPLPQGKTPDEVLNETLQQINTRLKESSGLDFKITDTSNPEYDLAERVRTLLSQEDFLVQDLGFIKIMCMSVNDNELIAVEVPSKLFKGKKVTAKQMETINNIENILDVYRLSQSVEEKEQQIKKLYRDVETFIDKKHPQQ